MYMDDIKLFAKMKKKTKLVTTIHQVRIHCQDLGMEYGIEKCAMLVMKSDNRDESKNKKTYLRRTKKLLETKLF